MRDKSDDDRLVAAFRAGDDGAFARIFDRHHRALLRYARKVLGRSSEHAEDVVQEAMLRASRALRRDERRIALRPWLYRLVRNCALDELARLRTDSVALEDADGWGTLRAAEASEPEVATERHGRVRDVLGDLAELPAQQRHALLRREVDGISHAALAGELGITQQATKNLVHRARTNLAKQEEARSADCRAVQGVLLQAHDEGRRASAAAYRHLTTCRDCRTFRSGLRRTSRAVALVVPGPLLVVAFGLLTGKAAAATGKGALVKSGASVAAGAAITAGAVVGGVEVFGPGDPAPRTASSRALPDGRVVRGRALPAGTAIVRKEVPAERGAVTVSLPCPNGLRVADLLASRGASATYASGTIVGSSRAARVVVEPRPDAGSVARVTVLCKAPDESGSIVAGRPLARAAAGATLHVRVDRAELFESPGGDAVGSVRLDQPVKAAPGRAVEGWRRIATDTGVTGWVHADVVR